MPRSLLLILITFLALGVSYSLVTPPLEPPDEALNYANALFIAQNRTLPVLQAGEKSKAHHPPLYYALSALVIAGIDDNLDELTADSNRYFGYNTYIPGIDNKIQTLPHPDLLAFPWHGAALGIHLLRFLSVLMGMGAIAAVWRTASLLTDDAPTATLAALLVAFNPMFVYIQSSVHNDALTNLLAAVAILAAVRYWQRPNLPHAVQLALVAALGILAKITFLFLGPMIAVLMVVRATRSHAANERPYRNIVVAAALVVATAGWWFVRNSAICGDPTCMNLQQAIWQPRPNSPDWAAAWGELDYLFSSFWGAFGFGQITLPAPIYLACHAVVIIALLGLIRVRWRTYDRLLIALLIIAPVSAFAATFWRMSVSATANFGRYTFTTYAVLAPLLAWGLLAWLPRFRQSLVRLFALLLLAFNLYALVGIIRPVYASPHTIDKIAMTTIAHPLEIEYAGVGRLLGYDITPSTAVLSDTVNVTVYWQTTAATTHNLTQFVQLVDADYERIGSRDTYHALGRYPSRHWQPDTFFSDTIPVPLTRATHTPAALRLIMGLFDADDPANKLTATNGQTTHTLGFMRLDGRQPAIVGAPVQYRFGDSIELVGVSAVTHTADTLDFTLTWQSIAPVAEDVTVFVHLLDEAGNLVNTSDAPPAQNRFPAHLWQPGDTIIDTRQHPLPTALPPGKYTLTAGLYSTADVRRLPVRPAALNDAITLYTWERE